MGVAPHIGGGAFSIGLASADKFCYTNFPSAPAACAVVSSPEFAGPFSLLHPSFTLPADQINCHAARSTQATQATQPTQARSIVQMPASPRRRCAARG